ncbi:MAG: hypothetical protein ABSH50_11610 [Bryobacteraceae bacterium]|jgi:hypothetical protein
MWEPLIPKEVSDWMDLRGWGPHHQLWHFERWWDLNPSVRGYVLRHGGQKANRQEGEPGNGLDFLAMHRTMVRALKLYFPRFQALWLGWNQVPTDPDYPADSTDVMPFNKQPRQFDANYLKALERLHRRLEDFQSDDDLGLYIETLFRRTPGQPYHLGEPDSGIHNYLHNRFMLDPSKTCDPDQAVSMGYFFGNIKNQRFWRLHGWIDRVWTRFRELKHLSEDDPAYQAALKEQAMPTQEMPDMCAGGNWGNIDRSLLETLLLLPESF